MEIRVRPIEGQQAAKRALEIAACGGYNLVMVGADKGDAVVTALLTFIVSNALGPLALITIVLLYYDCRGRKEHFDSEGLAQELMQ